MLPGAFSLSYITVMLLIGIWCLCHPDKIPLRMMTHRTDLRRVHSCMNMSAVQTHPLGRLIRREKLP